MWIYFLLLISVNHSFLFIIEQLAYLHSSGAHARESDGDALRPQRRQVDAAAELG